MRSDQTARSLRPAAEHFVAPLDETPLQKVDAVDTTATPRSMWGEASHNLVRNPVFVISALLILLLLFVAAFPGVFTQYDPTKGDLSISNQPPGDGHLLGTTRQGYDVWARVLYGTRTSLTVGFFAMVISTVIGVVIGAFAGYVGGWVDEVLSRITEIFFALPLVLGAIVAFTALSNGVGTVTIALILALFGWTNIARITRGTVLSVKYQDFVTASTALGAGRLTNLAKHVLPNAIAPVIVTATVNLGVFIVAQSTLAYLGLGTGSVSWGGDISDAQPALRNNPMMLFYPSFALAICVLSFIMLGDAVRDALDPKARKR
ncbi:peptide ABC transporter permease [Brachybacterium endophyticum]|uniref:Peptide ABC transporter permease n=1 Tax=Brachybacterium endophyticum TaxID=2182385 RepID=A0A2U2RLR2_9MICO|nr:ABC transporter permease [Brachybacterium endophyticum]PWH06809.1 peptide ABC transporter permease [Brachybacterium endophyticum]